LKESLHGWKRVLTRARNTGAVRLSGPLHPLPAAPASAGSLTGWILLIVVLALVVASGLVLASRR
jgi:hypothetical protein